jgi:hypothetical protein
MTEVYFDQLTSWRVKLLLCHEAYHDADTSELVFDEPPGTPLGLAEGE